jgi:hypothetical protein
VLHYLSTTPWRLWGSGFIDLRFIYLITSWKWVIRFTPLVLYSLRKSPRQSLDRIGGWVGPRACLDDMRKWKFLTHPGLELRPLCRQTRPQSLYRIRYRGSCPRCKWVNNIKMDLRWDGVRIDCIDVAQDRDGPVEDSCEHSNEPSGSWVGAQLSASQEGLSSMKLIGLIYTGRGGIWWNGTRSARWRDHTPKCNRLVSYRRGLDHLYSIGTQFESRQGHRLLLLRPVPVFHSPSKQMQE